MTNTFDVINYEPGSFILKPDIISLINIRGWLTYEPDSFIKYVIILLKKRRRTNIKVQMYLGKR